MGLGHLGGEGSAKPRVGAGLAADLCSSELLKLVQPTAEGREGELVGWPPGDPSGYSE